MNLEDISAELLHLKKDLADQQETMLGILDNGAWVRIPDPALREFVSRYVAETVIALAIEVDADDVQRAAEQLRGGGQLPLSLSEES